MENSYKFFENKECQYYPCHKGIEEINCLFCYCPMYFLDKCPGNPKYIERNGKMIKNCADCAFPHKSENYNKVMAVLKEEIW